MRIHRKLLGAVAGIVLVGVLPGIAAANTSEAVASTSEMTLTIPGVPLTIGVTLDDFGNITEVVVDDDDFVETRSGDHKVKFIRDDADGSTTIKVKAKQSKLTAKFKTANLSDILGANVWTADIFGTGDITTVTFTVASTTGPLGDYGKITGVVIDSGFNYTIKGPSLEDEGDEIESKAKVYFAFDGYKKTLSIEVETEFATDDDDDGTHTKIKIELKGKDKRELLGVDALGAHTWQGLLCDGTTATVSYTVTADGVTIDSIGVAGGVLYDRQDSDDGFKIRFTDTNGDSKARVKVQLEDEDGTLELKVKSKTTTSCKHDDDDEDDDDNKDKKRKDKDDDHDDDDDDHDDDDDDEDDDDDHDDDDDDDDDD